MTVVVAPDEPAVHAQQARGFRYWAWRQVSITARDATERIGVDEIDPRERSASAASSARVRRKRGGSCSRNRWLHARSRFGRSSR